MSIFSQSDITGVVREYLDSQDWHYQEEDNVFSVRMGIRGKLNRVLLTIKCKDTGFVCYTKPELSIPDQTLNAAMKYITCANYGMSVGNFEINQLDGEIRFKCFVSCQDDIPTMGHIEALIDSGIIMFTRYGDGLIDVIYNNADPIETCRQVEDED